MLAVDAEQHPDHDRPPAFASPAETPPRRERERDRAPGRGSLASWCAVDRASSIRCWVRASIAYARTVAAPTTGSETAPSMSPDPLAHHAVRRGEPPLEEPERGEQRQEADPDHDRQLPASRSAITTVATDDLADADDRDDAAEDCRNWRDLVDVAGDPGDQRAAALGVLGEQRQVVHVPERLDPQRRPARARRLVNSRDGHQVRRRGRSPRHADRGDHRDHGRRTGRSGHRRASDALVEGLLHRDRHDDPADRWRARASARVPPMPSLSSGRELDAAADRAHRGADSPVVQLGAGRRWSGCSSAATSSSRSCS